MFLPFFFAILFQFAYSQQVIPLNVFLGGDVNNKINATPPYSLYVSAHGDSSDILRQIYVKTVNNQIKSLDDLKHARTANTGLLEPMRIQSQAYVSSMLADSQMAALDGFIYITTGKQGNNDNFKVFDVAQSQVISTTNLQCDPCTMVFLNTNGQMTPVQSSKISTWHQSPEAVVKMYRGFPTDKDEPENTQIFSNPIYTPDAGKNGLLVPTVEKFSVSLGTFYLKTSNELYFIIEPGFFNLDGYGTTGYHSTGFYMKSRIQDPQNVTMLCVRDTRFNGTTGMYILGSIPNENGTVSATVYGEKSIEGVHMNPKNYTQNYSTKMIGRMMTISSKYSTGGEFFLQYYVIQDQQISSTFAPGGEPTTVSVETTTKAGSMMDCMVGTIMMATISWVL